MNTCKIVFIGAGGICFGLNTFRDIFSSGELKGSRLCLVDTNGEALERMRRLAVAMNEATKSGLEIEATTDRRLALPGADFVIHCTAIDRIRLWKKDFEVPRKYGVRHTLGENGGPGGLFFTLRTIPLVMDIARDMEELCPRAYFINFSNPESRIILALGLYRGIRSIGLCHGIFGAHADTAKIMGMDKSETEVWAAGLNHFQWLLEVREKSTGRDLYPLLRSKDASYDPGFQPLTRKLFRAFGLYPSCDDFHIGEYLAYGWEAGEDGYDFEDDARYRDYLAGEIDKRARGEAPWGDWLEPSAERSIHIVTGILHNKKLLVESGIVFNRGAIANLPREAAVEVPVMVDGAGVHPFAVGDLPKGVAALCSTQVDLQRLSVEAAVRGSRELAMQALLADPVVNSADAAAKIMDELWELNSPYIRACL